jgi:hypothetical protein
MERSWPVLVHILDTYIIIVAKMLRLNNLHVYKLWTQGCIQCIQVQADIGGCSCQ